MTERVGSKEAGMISAVRLRSSVAKRLRRGDFWRCRMTLYVHFGCGLRLTKPAYKVRRPVGFFAGLTPEQQKAALEYRGKEG